MGLHALRAVRKGSGREHRGAARPGGIRALASAGRALDLGCGRGQFTPGLARRGWAATGIDYIPAAIDAARRRGAPRVAYVVGDVTDLVSAGLGTFDFFLDVGCFQGFDADQRRAVGRGVSALANPGATSLMLAFSSSRFRT
jgi:2-polyprenyl-3-methyl-5-hydroxy-6-metoxy-1,4-benzoquinol methylase